MYRREILKAAATAAVGGAALIAGDGHILAASERSPGPARRAGSFVHARDGTELFVRDWGRGAALVFLSGWALPSDIWAYQMAPLAEKNLRCIAYDRRGHGRSSDPGRGYDYDTLADDLADVLEALDLRSVTFVAHSMAGGEVVRYLTRHGSTRVARLVLVGTTLPFMMKSADNPDGIDPAVFEQGRRNVLLKDFPKALNENMRPFVVPDTSGEMLEWVKGLMLQCSMQALVECNRALTATDFRGASAKIDVPTLLIHGDRDVSAPLALTARKAASLIPHARLAIYEGAPHGLLLTHASRLNDDLLAVTGGCAQAGSPAGC
jgi:pimeloyl-ACP methyl ester carboxylesterase